MAVDIPTMMIATSFLAMISGTLLILARYGYHDMQPVIWWAAAEFVLAGGVLLLSFAGDPPDGPDAIFAFALLTLAPALIWVSVRRFCGKTAPLWLVLAGPVAVLVAGAISPVLPVISPISVGSAVAYLVAAAWTMAFRAPRPLMSRWPIAVLCLVHALALALTVPIEMMGTLPGPLALLSRVIDFEALVFVLGTAVFVVAAMRETSELRHADAASTDSLTGLSNRRAFLGAAERIIERAHREGHPCAAVVFDLDHFKSINDSHGHATGDHVLTIFADVMRKTLRPNDVLGRMGGEEFAALIGGAGLEAGVALADRVRRTFAEAAAMVDGVPMSATLSAGISVLRRGDDLDSMLRRADGALYSAKMHGRNRVEASPEPRGEGPVKLVRVA